MINLIHQIEISTSHIQTHHFQVHTRDKLFCRLSRSWSSHRSKVDASKTDAGMLLWHLGCDVMKDIFAIAVYSNNQRYKYQGIEILYKNYDWTKMDNS